MTAAGRPDHRRQAAHRRPSVPHGYRLPPRASGVTVDWLLTGKAPARPLLAARKESAALAPPAVPQLVDRCAAAYEVLDLLHGDEKRTGPPVHSRKGAARLAHDAVSLLAQHGRSSVAGLETPDLADAIEEVLGIDVAIDRLPPGLDGPSWQTDGHRLCVLAATQQWARQRFTLAHEVGHILAGHAQNVVADQHLAPALAADPTEIIANRFAAAFLMPEAEVRSQTPAHLEIDTFSKMVVQFKVSPSALAVRLKVLRLVDTSQFDQFRSLTSVRCHELAGNTADYVRRVNTAMSRRLPSKLITALYEAYRAGQTTLRPLANLIDVDVDALHDALTSGSAGEGPASQATADDLAYEL